MGKRKPSSRRVKSKRRRQDSREEGDRSGAEEGSSDESPATDGPGPAPRYPVRKKLPPQEFWKAPPSSQPVSSQRGSSGPAADKQPWRKTKRGQSPVPVKDDDSASSSDESELEEPYVGGTNAITVGPANIALLTYKAASESAVKKSYIYQVLQKISTNKIFKTFLQGVAGQKPDWRQTAREQRKLPENKRSIDESVLDRLEGVEKSASIAVVDRNGFPDGEDDIGPATYNSITHTIEIQNVHDTDGSLSADYWACFKSALFELCNASQRHVSLAVDRAAEKGELDCVSFVLAVEVVELKSGEIFDNLWDKVSTDKDCCTAVDPETGEARAVKAPRSRYRDTGTTRLDRLNTSIGHGHADQFIQGWYQQYSDAYGQRPESGTFTQQRLKKLGITVTQEEVKAMQARVASWLKNPQGVDSDEDDPEFFP
ncbi:hypothetical protein [Nonomuraea sp. NPDC049750]|uniref:hypothetical protein n=1 Tax=Nonomuraea sp. NPDC049750 TaxID=3154738 RepID=UPI00340801B3